MSVNLYFCNFLKKKGKEWPLKMQLCTGWQGTRPHATPLPLGALGPFCCPTTSLACKSKVKWKRAKLLRIKVAKISKHLKGQLWPPSLGNVFVYSCPTPLPGQLWPPLGNVFAYSCPTPLPGQLWPPLGNVFAYSCPNCIPARRSSLGPPPGGRHRT